MQDTTPNDTKPAGPLRYGWTTGTCATAATRAAVEALWTGTFPDPVCVVLPNGVQTAFALAEHHLEPGPGISSPGSASFSSGSAPFSSGSAPFSPGSASAAIIKDAGDDPDVTHGAMVIATVRLGEPGSGVTFRAGPGVGMVTRPGLAIAPGEPAINPVPRQMMRDAIVEAAKQFSQPIDIVVEISIPGGDKIAEKTLNPRLGIVGGLSILGTTGIVVPFSCSAWIHSIHRGIDVARATGITHVAGASGSTSEAAIAKLYQLPDVALIDMGDFAGGMLKYLKAHPIERVTVAGGFAKMSKLAMGRMDLHSRRGVVDLDQIAQWLHEAGASHDLVSEAKDANTAQQILGLAQSAGLDLASAIAERARQAAAKPLAGSGIALDVVVFDRDGNLCGRSQTVTV